MQVSFDFIHGLVFGIEYVAKDLEQDIDETAVIIEFAIFRVIIWTGDYEE